MPDPFIQQPCMHILMNCRLYLQLDGSRGGVVGLSHYATSQKVGGSFPDEVITFFNWPTPSSRNKTLGSTQPLTDMSTRNFPGGKGQQARKADNFTAICEPIVLKMWEPRRLTPLWASTSCYRDSLAGYQQQDRSMGQTIGASSRYGFVRV
jgi:hypothetical protein